MSANPNPAEAIFLAAADIADPVARAALLDERCAGDAELRRRIELLLKAHDAPDSLLDQPVPTAEELPTRAMPVEQSETTQAYGRTLDDEEELDALAFLAPSGRPDSLGKIGQYDVLEVLGKGAFGIVFRAFDDKLQRVVAVKVLAPSLATTSPARKRFLREARSSASVRHEHVVQVHAVEEQPLPHLVMEFVPGETLQQRMDRTGPLELAEVIGIGRQIAEGLAAAHGQGLIHRDIKPSNILVNGGPNPTVKITDFGLARAADDASLTRSGVVAGTPMYMAPEQAKGETLDHRADLFSLGSAMYVMTTGRPPFRASTTFAVLKRVAEDEPRPIREIIPETPEWLCRIIEKMHAKDPGERYRSARDVADVLRDCEHQLKSEGRVKDWTRIPAVAAAQTRRRRWAAFAVPTLLALAAIVWFASGPIRSRFKGVPVDANTGRLIVEVRDPGQVSIEIFNEGEQVVTRRLLDHSRGQAFNDLLPFGRWHVVARYAGVTSPFREVFELGPEGKTVVVPAFAGPPSPTSEPARAVAPFDAAQAKAHQDAWAKYLGVPVEFTDEFHHTFRLIPPGEFEMGTSEKDVEKLIAESLSDKAWEWSYPRLRSESPVRKVRIESAFYMATHETTVRQFRDFVKATGYKTRAERDGGGWVYKGLNAERKPDAVWNSPKYFVSDDAPVGYLVRDDADAYCRWLSRKTGHDVALPTEERWEYACRAGTTTAWSHSHNPDELKRYAWTSDAIDSPLKTVGLRVPNPFGLYDMHGNVDELTLNAAGEAFLRGGSVSELAVMARSARRVPVDDFLPYRASGFRIVTTGDLKKAAAKRESPTASADGFAPLFNGKNLTGWKTVGGTPATWAVENGAIRAAGSEGYLVGDQSFGEFQFKAEVRISPDGKWSILTHVDPTELGMKGKSPRGIGIELTDKGPTNDVQGHRSMEVKLTRDGLPLAIGGANLKPNDWFPIEVTVRDSKIDARFKDGSVGASNLKPGLARGSIALHLAKGNSAVEFRAMEIRELPATSTRAKPDPDVVKAIKAKLAAAESALAIAEARFRAAVAPKTEVLTQQLAVIDVKIDLAEVENRQADVVNLAEQAVKILGDRREMLAALIKNGRIPAGDLIGADAAVAEAKLRLARAKLKLPETKP